jgi:hypothetical protein
MNPGQAFFWTVVAVFFVLAVLFVKQLYRQSKVREPRQDPSTIKVDWTSFVVSIALMGGSLFGYFAEMNWLFYGGFAISVF